MKILMLPWLAHGHISPFLELAKSLSKRNFHVYLLGRKSQFLCSTPINLTSIKQKLTSIELVELDLPSFPNLPPHYHITNGLPPHLMPILKTVFDMSKPIFSTILDTIEPDLLIYDFLQPWAPKVALLRNIPAILLLSAGATSTSYFIHLQNNPNYERVKIDRLINSIAYDLKDQDRFHQCTEQSSAIVLIKTCRAIEGKFIDYLPSMTEKRMVPVGPLVQILVVNDDDEKPEIIQWLDKKEHCSTVFASFGSEYFLSKEEMEEIAQGLELSNVNFIWVVRFPIGERIRVEEALLQGFLEKMKRKRKSCGGVDPTSKDIRTWRDWRVCESLWMEFSDGGLVEEVGVGVEVKRNGDGRVKREEVARVIREVVKGESGEIIRKKAKELSEEMRKKKKRWTE
ncbi:hypothetical protein ACSBR1_007344 [Camellia fascicularis]